MSVQLVDIVGARHAIFFGVGGPDGLGTHRLTLWREARYGWQGVNPEDMLSLEAPSPFALCVLLNPSTATATRDDPTIRRLVSFTRSWGFKALCVGNAYSYRATEPADMFAAQAKGVDIVGTLNNEILRTLAGKASLVLAGWGGNIEPARQVDLVAMLPGLHALAVNVDHSPKHPLYIKGDAVPMPYGLPAPGSTSAARMKKAIQAIPARNMRFHAGRP